MKIDWHEADMLGLFLKEWGKEFDQFVETFGYDEQEAQEIRTGLQQKFAKRAINP